MLTLATEVMGVKKGKISYTHLMFCCTGL